MANPTTYTVSYSFEGYQDSNPTDPLPAMELDIELANIASAISSVRGALLDVRASDGSLVNGIVTWDALDADLKETISPTGSATTFASISSTAFASQAEATAGTANDKLMTPLRTSQAVAARFAALAVSGTANAPVITTGLNLDSIPVGYEILYQASVTNTATVIFSVDGNIAEGKTPTGSDLPADYIRTDALTRAWWNGTNWIVGRQPETAAPLAGVNGRYIRYEDGAMACFHVQSGSNTLTSAVGSLFRGTVMRTWTFPATFTEKPAVTATYDRSDGLVLPDAVTTTEFDFYPASAVSAGATSAEIILRAEGRWY